MSDGTGAAVAPREEQRPAEPGPAGLGDRAGFRLAAFGAVLVVVLFAGYGLGRLNGGGTAQPPAHTDPAAPGRVADESQPHAHGEPAAGPAPAPGSTSAAGAAPAAAEAGVGGLALSSGGLTLRPSSTDFVAGQAKRLEYRIAGPGGAAVTTFAVVHDKPMHLIVVRRDLTGFQHLHPTMAPDGTWGIDLTLAAPGIYRMIADFTALVGGEQRAVTLGADLTVAGNYAPVALPAPGRQASTDGYTVAYEGTPDTRSSQPLLFTVNGPDGAAAALEPYLGAYGHLVVLRQGDLGYVHVHPEEQLVDGKPKFWIALPSAGNYRMFFDFQVGGQVRTAAWSVSAE